jgi:hypothetical protein
MTAQLTEVSQLEVARRIARQHNRDVEAVPGDVAAERAGYLVFDARGRLLSWQRHGLALVADANAIAFPLRPHKVTTAEVVAFLQARDGSAPHRDQAKLYGSTARKPVEEVVT